MKGAILRVTIDQKYIIHAKSLKYDLFHTNFKLYCSLCNALDDYEQGTVSEQSKRTFVYLWKNYQ